MHPDAAAAAVLAPPAWRMPVMPEDYDRHPLLRPEEREALELLGRRNGAGVGAGARAQAYRAVARLDQPALDIAALSHTVVPGTPHCRYGALPVLHRAMATRGTPFWAWAPEEWVGMLRPTAADYHRRYGVSNQGRRTLMHLAYLLGGVTDMIAMGHGYFILDSARLYFGHDLVERQLARLTDTLVGHAGLGFTDAPGQRHEMRRQVCRLFVLNRSPSLEDLAAAVARLHRPAHDRPGVRPPSPFEFHRLRQALICLGLIAPAQDHATIAQPYDGFDTTGMAPEWAAWCVAWYRRGTHAPVQDKDRRTQVCMALFAGRWLLRHHPAVVSPEHWDEDLALECVDAVCRMSAGEYASARGREQLRRKGALGLPLRPAGISNRLHGMRRLFGDLQDYPHAVGDAPPRKIALNFKPLQAFATPLAIQRLDQREPRDIDMALWYKLVYAAATLAREDLPPNTQYPLSFWRAVALVWISAGRRSDEIMRLRVDCVRRDWAPDMLSADGQPVEATDPAAAAPLCYLRVPSGKWRGPFWIWIPEYTADAIDAWLAERPPAQPPLWDAKDRAMADYLFCYKWRRMDKVFINRRVIPALFAKATGDREGAPRDARGVITSHRGRSQRATILRMLGVPLDDIAAYLGHQDSATVTRYARTDPLQLARTIQKASDLERIVEGVIDLQAAAEGRPSVRWWLGWDADGEPRYCGHPAWHTCAHRLECQKCSAFIGGGAARVLKEGENVIPIQARVPMTPVEKAATDGNVELFNELLAQLKDTPPPTPTSPSDIHNPMAFTPAVATMMSKETKGDALAQLNQELAILMRSLADAERAPKGRSVLLTSLRRKIESVRGEMAALEPVRGDRDRRKGSVS